MREEQRKMVFDDERALDMRLQVLQNEKLKLGTVAVPEEKQPLCVQNLEKMSVNEVVEVSFLTEIKLFPLY